MKKCFLFISLMLSLAAKSQTLVDIPDSNFRKALKKDYSHFFRGEQFLSSDSVMMNIPILYLNNKGIKSLEGIQYFTHLSILYCDSNQLVDVPVLPVSLKLFSCASNKISSFGKFHEGLLTVFFQINNFKDFPDLPNSVVFISSDQNLYTSISKLPDSLRSLSCDNNRIRRLPELPKKLEFLSCQFCDIDSLPELPNNLQNLFITYSDLQVLPELPKSLKGLAIGGTKVKEIPILPQTLTFLTCNQTEISNLPSLPNNLETLMCSYNLNLTCLPFLPNTIKYLFTENTGLGCLPNIPTSLEEGQIYLPVCNRTNNSNGCETFTRISGEVFFDENSNGQKDETEKGFQGAKLKLNPSGYEVFSDKNGRFEISDDSLRKSTLVLNVPKFFNCDNDSLTILPEFHGENFTGNFPLVSNKNVKDLQITATPLVPFARPGFSFPIQIEVKNNGTITENGTSYIELSSMYEVDSFSNSTNGYFNFQDLYPGQLLKLMVYGKVSTSAPLGDTLKFRGIVNIYDYTTDSNYANNFSSINVLVRGSFDPNDKQGPISLSPKQIQNGDFLDYIIRFQNTGTDTAFTVVVADTLTQNLVPNTLEMVSTSHLCKTTVEGNKVYFEFKNILLVDSNTNEPMSHGFVHFKVKAKSTLVLGQTIQNTASIYFDFNKPVVTNTVTTNVSEPLISSTEVNLIQSNIGSMAYPNPVEGDYIYVRDFDGCTYILSDTQGQALMKGKVSETGINVSQLKPGVYMLETIQNQSRKVEKVVVK